MFPLAYRIHISLSTFEILREFGGFDCEFRGTIEVKVSLSIFISKIIFKLDYKPKWEKFQNFYFIYFLGQRWNEHLLVNGKRMTSFFSNLDLNLKYVYFFPKKNYIIIAICTWHKFNTQAD